MKSRLTTVAALVAFVVLFATPSGPVCAWTAEVAHGCCAQEAAQTAAKPDSCCGKPNPVEPSPAWVPVDGCDCMHAPTAPPAVAVGTPTSTETASDAAFCLSDGVAQGDSRPIQASRDARSRGGPPGSLLFLTNCAFLI